MSIPRGLWDMLLCWLGLHCWHYTDVFYPELEESVATSVYCCRCWRDLVPREDCFPD